MSPSLAAPVDSTPEAPQRAKTIKDILGPATIDAITHNLQFQAIWSLYFEHVVKPIKDSVHGADPWKWSARGPNFTTIEDMVEEAAFNHLTVDDPLSMLAGYFDRTRWSAWCLHQLCELDKTSSFLKAEGISDRRRRFRVWELVRYLGDKQYGEILRERWVAAKKRGRSRSVLRRRRGLKDGRR